MYPQTERFYSVPDLIDLLTLNDVALYTY